MTIWQNCLDVERVSSVYRFETWQRKKIENYLVAIFFFFKLIGAWSFIIFFFFSLDSVSWSVFPFFLRENFALSRVIIRLSLLLFVSTDFSRSMNVDDPYAANVRLVSWLSYFQERIYIECITHPSCMYAGSFIKMMFATNAWRIVRRCVETVITGHLLPFTSYCALVKALFRL